MSENAEHADKNVEIWKVSENQSEYTKIPNFHSPHVFTFPGQETYQVPGGSQGQRHFHDLSHHPAW